MTAGFHTLAEVDEKSRLFYVKTDDIVYDEKAVDKFLRKGETPGLEHLRRLRDLLDGLGDWSVGSLETAIKGYAEEHGAGLGKVAQPLRVAVSGTSVSPPIFDTLAFLGKTETLARIDRCLREVATD